MPQYLSDSDTISDSHIYLNYYALTDASNYISMDLDTVFKYNLSIFLVYLRKLFDTVDHSILVWKLECYIILIVSCEVLRYYLSQFVPLHKTESFDDILSVVYHKVRF